MSLRLGYNTNGFPNHRLLDVLDILAETGYTSVGLTLDVHHAPPGTDYAALGRECRARGLLPVVETGARFLLDPRRKHHPSLLSADGRRRRIDFYLACLDAADALGAPCISLWSGRDEGGDSWALLAEGLREVCERARVDVAFEPEPGMFVEACAGYSEVARRVGHPRLKLTLDVGHVACLEDEPPDALIARHAAALANVHLDDQRRGVHQHLFPGEGEVDWESTMAALRVVSRGRDLPATVELSRHVHDPVDAARRAYDFLAPLAHD